ncbi:CZB domain-containing protein [Salmonella enterica]|nr:CZB domain-containing protein [Salmonella enterica]
MSEVTLFKSIYQSLQQKLFNVNYTTDKASAMRQEISVLAGQWKTDSYTLSGSLGKLYSLRKMIKKEQSSSVCKKLPALLDEIYHETIYIQNQMFTSANTISRFSDRLMVIILKSQHYQWRESIYIAALRRECSFPVQGESECALGRWYYSEGKARFSHYPAFQKLGLRHIALHHSIQSLLQTGFSELSENEILQAMEKLETCSQSLIATLDELDSQIQLSFPFKEKGIIRRIKK